MISSLRLWELKRASLSMFENLVPRERSTKKPHQVLNGLKLIKLIFIDKLVLRNKTFA